MRLFSLSLLSDQEFDASLAAALKLEHKVVAFVLTHLVEAEHRKRFLSLGYPSLYEYCVHELKMTESVAYKRTAAARAVRRFPDLLEAISSGKVSLSALVLILPHLTEHTYSGLMSAVAGQPIANVRLMLAHRFPRPDLPTLLRALPTAPVPEEAPGAARLQGIVTELDTYPTDPSVATIGTQLMGPLLTLPASAEPIARITPRSPGRFALQVMLSEAAHDDLKALRELLGHRVPTGEISEVLERVLGIARRVIEKQKYAATQAPRISRGSDDARYIPAEIKRQVCERDGNRCAFVSASGKRCDSRMRLEFDHRVPLADGGETCVQNVRLLCRAHNFYEAERTMGEQRVKQARDVAMQQRARERVRTQLPR